MRLFIHHPHRKHLLVSRDRVREFHNPASAREFLRPLMGDPRNRAAVRDLAESGATGLMRWNDHDARDQLAERLAREDLVVIDYTEERLETPHETRPSASTPLDDQMAAPKAPEPAPPPASAAPPPANDPMLAGIDQVAQAQVLQQAAAGGTPLCEP